MKSFPLVEDSLEDEEVVGKKKKVRQGRGRGQVPAAGCSWYASSSWWLHDPMKHSAFVAQPKA